MGRSQEAENMLTFKRRTLRLHPNPAGCVEHMVFDAMGRVVTLHAAVFLYDVLL